MNQITRGLVAGVSLLILIFIGVLATVLPVSAEPVSVALSSSASSVQQNSNFVVTATVNTAGEVSDALVRINYDSSKVSYVSASFSGYPLDQDFGSQAGPNYYVADRYKLGAPFPTGSITVVNITFRASVSSGSTTINVDTGASTIGNATNGQPHTPLTASNTVVNFTAPPTNTTAPSSPSSSNSTTQNQPTAQAETGQPTSQEQEINSSVDDDQPVPVGSFVDQTGYPVEVKIVDATGNPVVGLEVKLNDQTSTTSDEGIAQFSNITVGEYTIEAKGVNGTVSVATGDPLIAQEYLFTQEETNSPLTFIIIAIASIALLAATAFAVTMLKKKRRNNNTTSISNPLHHNNEQTSTEENNQFLKPNPPRAETIIEPENRDRN